MRRRSILAVLTFVAVLPAACTVGPNFTRPVMSDSAGYANASGQVMLAEGPELRWWTAFGSAELDALVDRALAGNRSLEASNATLERARQRVRAAAGASLPQIDGNARAEHERVNLSAFGLDSSALGGTFTNPEFELYSVGAGVTYDLDLFGRNRRALEQAGAEAEAQQRQTEAAHLTIAGRVVNQVMTIAALRDRIAAEQSLLAESRRNVALTQARQRGGEGTLVEVLSAQGELAADQGNIPQLEQQVAAARDLLAVLLGISPAELGSTEFTLAQFTLPSPVPVALPSALVHHRPDILQAEAQLHAATAAVGVATANLYPDVTLGASLTQSSTGLGNILGGGSRGYDIFAGLTAPIFHGGTLTAQKREAEAAARAATATYQQTVLEAFQQVSDLLAALDSDTRSLANQQQAVEIAGRSLHLSRRSFQVGNSGILQVLEASRTQQRASVALVDAQARRYLNVARLYVATAGGWSGPAVATSPPR
ncbi:MAG: transporter [Novosphingobium sp.]|nr:transporter [Novosphingobium sp.]